MELYNLLQQAHNGHKEAVISIYLRFNPTIKKFSRKLRYEEAETDLIIALLELIRDINLNKLHMQSDGAIVNYIYRFLKNKSINLLKKNILQNLKTVPLESTIISDAKIHIDSMIFTSSLINSLPSLQREVIKRKFVQEFSDREIANLLGISRQAVNRAKNRGLHNLRKTLHLKEEENTWKKKYLN
ncbi:RNA polymerase sigma factor [Anaerophilus nitritogenes]|uniref:RNA polymerase sigma factor n=1 Tax=Anaerophilus nitritogenes TaxID=2498136 RepID=UPI00101CAE6D|nr:sigma-70 family RNA polymerase sigma factor [Anaerophilus nitritogenes]